MSKCRGVEVSRCRVIEVSKLRGGLIHCQPAVNLATARCAAHEKLCFRGSRDCGCYCCRDRIGDSSVG